MNRELKFRAWVKRRNRHKWKMVEVLDDNYLWVADNKLYAQTWDSVHEYNGKYEIMQFTGLQDSEGVDIYEGDVVRTNSGKTFTFPSTFDFSKSGPRFIWGYRIHLQGFEPCKVIGNIYESPELLEEA